VFLDAVEESAQDPDPPVMALFVEHDPFGLAPTGRHSSLLWALEALAFSARHLPRVAVALGQLAEADPGGRLANRPTESLVSVLHLVLPQGAADEAGRMAIVDAVRRAAPQAGWKFMMSLIGATERGLILRQGPRFREWHREAPPPTYGDVARALTGLAERIAEDARDDGRRWAAALGTVDRVPPAARDRLLEAADAAWPGLDEDAKRNALAGLDERVNRHARFRDAAWALDDNSVERLQAFLDEHAVAGTQPDDADLFGWWPRRAGLDPDTEEGTAALAAARDNAVRRALAAGVDGLAHLAEASELPEAVGETLALVTSEHDDQLLALLEGDGKTHRMAYGLARARWQADPAWLRCALEARPALAVELLLTGDVDDAVLSLLDDADPAVRAGFWGRVQPWRTQGDLAETVAERLLEHDRPFSAMFVLHDAARRGTLPVDLTLRAMKAPAVGTAEPLQAIPSPQYVLGELLDDLEQADLPLDELATLEWLYLSSLRHDRVPQALHRRLAADPAFFAEIVCAVYRRRAVNDGRRQACPAPPTLPLRCATARPRTQAVLARTWRMTPPRHTWRRLHGPSCTTGVRRYRGRPAGSRRRASRSRRG